MRILFTSYVMSQPASPPDTTQLMHSTKKSILIRPTSESDLNDFIYISNYKAGRKFRDALTRLSQRYNFSYNDYKRNRISISLDFAGIQQNNQAQAQENKG
jgi:hypothetical protein